MKETIAPVGFALDFDGTITFFDTLQVLLERYGDPEWRRYDDAVELGELPESDSITLQMNTLRISFETAIAEVAREIPLRDGVLDFFQACNLRGYPCCIVSGGYREIIAAFADRYRWDIAAFANVFEGYTADGGWTISNPHPRRDGCHYSQCKCRAVDELRSRAHRVVYIGDGITDYCAACICDDVFVVAEQPLARMLARDGKPFHSFHSFQEILNGAYFT